MNAWIGDLKLAGRRILIMQLKNRGTVCSELESLELNERFISLR